MVALGESPRPIAPVQLHREWGRRLAELQPRQLRSEVETIVERADLLGIWSASGMVPLQPFVLPRGATSHIHALSRDLHNLLVNHALDVSGGDLGRLADYLDWPDSERWQFRGRTPLDFALGSSRADVMVSNGAPRIIELNFGTCLNGSTSTPVLADAVLDSGVGRSLMGDHTRATGYIDALGRWLLRGPRGAGDRVALLSSIEASDEGATRWAEHQIHHLAGHGIKADLVPIEEMEVLDGVLSWNKLRYQQAVRFFMLNGPLLKYRDVVEAVEQAAGTRVYGSYISQLFTSKALLADVLQRPGLSGASKRALDAVPWTARLVEGPVWWRDREVDPIQWTLDNRVDAVLKPAHLYGSRGVKLGRLTPEPAWHDIVLDAVSLGDHVVQELVDPDSWTCSYYNLREDRLMTVQSPVILGSFTVDDQPAGTFVQQPTSGDWPGLSGGTGATSLGVAVDA